jgi:hypothetical protein
MPVAIGTALLGSALGGTAILGTTAASIVGSVVITAATVGASYALQSATAQQPKRELQQAVLNQSMGLRRRVYGQAMVGGTRYFWDARNGGLYQGIALASGRIHSIVEYYIGDQLVVPDGGGVVAAFPWLGRLYYEPFDGSAGQAASSILQAVYPEIWTADHRLSDIAHVVVVFGAASKEDNAKVWPQGANTVLRFVVKGALVWDTSVGGQDPENESTWTWSESPAHCILDFLRHRDGMRQPLARIDVASFEDMHATCVETVLRKDGSSEARYRLWGSYEFSEEPKDVLARMCATCDATLYQGPSGKIGIRDGKWTGPLVNISTEHIVSAALTQGNDKLDAYNRLKVSYTDPDAFYQATEMQARDDASSQAAIGVIDEQRDLVMVPSFSQAARLAKIAMAKDNPIWKGTLGTHLSSLDALGEAIVDITYDPVPDGDEPLMNAPCEITAFSLRGDASGCDIGFRSIPASAYDWDPEAEEPPRPATPGTIAPDLEIVAPTSLTTGYATRELSEFTVEITDTVWDPVLEENVPATGPVTGNVLVYVLTASWPAPPRADLSVELEYQSSGVWRAIAVADGATSAESGPVARSTSYAMRIRHVSGGGSTSDWTNGASVAVPD